SSRVVISPRILGATTSNGTLVSPAFDSSQVIKSTPSFRQAAELVICGTTRDSHRSAVSTPQSWPSLHKPGVIQDSQGVWPFRSVTRSVIGTTFGGHSPP